MLVLSRREKDSILLPELNVAIEILNIKGKSVRVGVDAPIEIKVLRGELEKGNQGELAQAITISGVDEHEVRNKLNSLNIGVALARKLIERGEFQQAASKLADALNDICDEPELKPDTECVALLVEDVDNEREMLAGFLRLHGYCVHTVSDGISALDYLENNPQPNLIMLDIGMPRMDGAELIRRIRETPSLDDVKLFAISGNTPRQANVSLEKNRIAKWFRKPLKPAKLVDEINREFRQPVSLNQ